MNPQRFDAFVQTLSVSEVLNERIYWGRIRTL